MAEPGTAFRKFLILWSGRLISAVGSGLTAFGLAVHVYRQTGKAAAVATVPLLAFLPALLLGAPAGVLADRHDRRLLMAAGDLLSAAGPAFILACLALGRLTFWQVCVGVAVSSAFSSLIEPAYRATVSDLLDRDQYTKAAGLAHAAGSAQYLISPILAWFLLTVSDLRLLLVLDIATFLITCLAALAVRRGLPSKPQAPAEPFRRSFAAGWAAIARKRGILELALAASLATFFLGIIQTLSAPMILAFADSAVLGSVETISAAGMLAGGVLMGICPIRSRHRAILSVSLFSAGLAMVLFGLRENIGLIAVSGFLFFAMLPPANACLDYLARTNIDASAQGRAWGLIGFISQLGYAAAYACAGILADRVFSPRLVPEGAFAGTLGRVFGTGAGRGAGALISVSGLLLSATAVALNGAQAIRALEPGRN